MFHTNNVERSPLYPLCFSGSCIHGRYEASHCVLSSSISVWFNGEMPWDPLQCVVHRSADNQAKEDISSFCTWSSTTMSQERGICAGRPVLVGSFSAVIVELPCGIPTGLSPWGLGHPLTDYSLLRDLVTALCGKVVTCIRSSMILYVYCTALPRLCKCTLCALDLAAQVTQSPEA